MISKYSKTSQAVFWRPYFYFDDFWVSFGYLGSVIFNILCGRKLIFPSVVLRKEGNALALDGDDEKEGLPGPAWEAWGGGRTNGQPEEHFCRFAVNIVPKV